MIYLDANIFLYASLDDKEKGDKCRQILTKVSKEKLLGATSSLTWDEIVHSVWKNKGRDIAIIEGEIFLKFPKLKILQNTNNTIARAQQVISKYNLKPRDAIHVATMLEFKITEIISDDTDFDKVKEIKRIKI